MKILHPISAFMGLGTPELIVILIIIALPIAVVACVVAVVLARKKKERNQPDSAHKKCPDCAEVVLVDANVCRHCGYRFNTEHATRA